MLVPDGDAIIVSSLQTVHCTELDWPSEDFFLLELPLNFLELLEWVSLELGFRRFFSSPVFTSPEATSDCSLSS